MWLISQLSSAARMALVYITIGALTVIWTGVWFTFVVNNRPESQGVYYWIAGFFITGLTLIAIGLGVGQIGRSAKTADAPPAQAVVQPTATVPGTPVVPAGMVPAATVPGTAVPMSAVPGATLAEGQPIYGSQPLNAQQSKAVILP